MRRLEDGNLAVPPALDRPMPGKLTLPEEPHLAALVGQIGPYQYVQPVNQLRRDNGWELVYDWGSFSVMRRLRPDAAPPPSLEAVISVAKDASKQLHRSNIWQLALLIAPAMALLRHNSHSNGQIVLLAGILLSLLFYVVLMRLFRRKRDESLSYEECLATTSALALVETILLGSFTAGILIYHTLKILLR